MASQESSKLPLSSSHRLPTVSASQALQSIKSRSSRAVSTGLTQLNKLLSPHGFPGSNLQGGLARGKVTEVYGPSGVGKTTFGIQAAVNALRVGNHVVWVDAAGPLASRRFNETLFACNDLPSSEADESPPPNLSPNELQSRFHHYSSPTLAHLLALFGHPPASFPPPNTCLIVIDSLSTLFDNAYPRNADNRAVKNKNDHSRWAAGRKFAVMNELISKLCRIAAMHDIALLLTCQTITRIRGSRALLVPAISSAEWENGISTRLVLFRDWVPGQGKWNDSDADKLKKARFVGVVKANGIAFAEETGVGTVVAFTIESTGLCDLNVAAVNIAAPAVHSSQVRPPKRRFTEIADSEGEDPDSDELYGWVEDDEVAAEGLIVDEAPFADDVNTAGSRTDDVPDKNLPAILPLG
ncbi:P-loop containing nucleoside triphosphate hydrolase protein [Zopfia rhizophila CBS 207.26]|uniref:P-loop containing nucleoside triphosphate hydrolase protein n=1 Tax=Zopfia rhizophila CBS 207.26 TaxID=1314779 RepID=A0A6A6DQE9_9PEZI|nr:P-loop containing nucleoside triphosphate hydrolase protein [Zopfia rhizophila CBS 207.26]